MPEPPPEPGPEPDDEYAIEPHDESPSPSSASPSKSPAQEKKPDHLPLEVEPDSPPDKSVHGLDVCPNCKSPMRGSSTLLCLRCGYDLKTMRVVKTKTGVAAVPDKEDAAPEALVRPGGVTWIPTALVAFGLLVLAVAALAGWRGLFPELVLEESVPGRDRWLYLVRLPIMLGVWTASGLVGLIAVAWLTERPFGDVVVALHRMVGIAAAAMVATLLSASWRFAEIAVECVGACGVFYALTLVLFRLAPREAARTLLFAAVGFVVIVVGAQLVGWAV